MTDDAALNRTPLNALHKKLGAKMVPFAGYEMPVQYADGVLKEHLFTRESAGLFDVSHMGQAWFVSEDGSDPAAALESLAAAELQALKPGRQRYTQLLNDAGGILDDLMVTRPVEALATDPDTGAPRLYIVVNAACKDTDFALISTALAGRARLVPMLDRALVALQGPKAVAVVADVFSNQDLNTAKFMSQTLADYQGAICWISRSGYTGEDGVEISVPADRAEALAEAFLRDERVKPIGLGARDSLRLESGLCLYGHDIDETTTPVEAGIAWSIGKRRREEGGFPGADKILAQLRDGAPRKRVGIQPEGRAPAREGTEIVDGDGHAIGAVTSGGFGPSVGGPVAMGYVETRVAEPGMEVGLVVRGKTVPAKVVTLPFVASGFYRG